MLHKGLMTNSTETKKCTVCHTERLLSEYWENQMARDGRRTQCKSCWYKKRKQHRKDNPEKHLDYSLRTRFDITLDEYKSKLLQQRGVCVICGQPETATSRGKVKLLSVDHNHSNGQIRGLLCDKCNHLIGNANEDIAVLDSAIRYISFYDNIRKEL